MMGVGVVIHLTRDVLLPFALAVFFSYILNPLITFFEKRKIPSIFAIIIAILITFTVLVLLGVLINVSIQSFAEEFPKYEDRFGKLAENILLWLVTIFDLPRELVDSSLGGSERFQLLTDLKTFSIASVVTTVLGTIAKFLSNTLLVMLFLLFILLGRNQFVRKLSLAFEGQRSAKIAAIAENINRQVQKYIVMKTLISLATALLATIVLLYFDVEFAIIWGILTFLLNFIPSIGSIIATILPVTIATIQFESYLTIVTVLLLLTAIQFILGSIVDPQVIGVSVNLSPLVILFSLIFWGWMWGVIGMFLAIPISVVLKIVFENVDELHFLSVLMSNGK
jgi:predicted PurR-regulated permease PerM